MEWWHLVWYLYCWIKHPALPLAGYIKTPFILSLDLEWLSWLPEGKMMAVSKAATVMSSWMFTNTLCTPWDVSGCLLQLSGGIWLMLCLGVSGPSASTCVPKVKLSPEKSLFFYHHLQQGWGMSCRPYKASEIIWYGLAKGLEFDTSIAGHF